MPRAAAMMRRLDTARGYVKFARVWYTKSTACSANAYTIEQAGGKCAGRIM